MALNYTIQNPSQLKGFFRTLYNVEVSAQKRKEPVATDPGILNQFYTPEKLAVCLWNMAYAHGSPPDGLVLEPACSTGRWVVVGHTGPKKTPRRTPPPCPTSHAQRPVLPALY